MNFEQSSFIELETIPRNDREWFMIRLVGISVMVCSVKELEKAFLGQASIFIFQVIEAKPPAVDIFCIAWGPGGKGSWGCSVSWCFTKSNPKSHDNWSVMHMAFPWQKNGTDINRLYRLCWGLLKRRMRIVCQICVWTIRECRTEKEWRHKVKRHQQEKDMH